MQKNAPWRSEILAPSKIHTMNNQWEVWKYSLSHCVRSRLPRREAANCIHGRLMYEILILYVQVRCLADFALDATFHLKISSLKNCVNHIDESKFINSRHLDAHAGFPTTAQRKMWFIVPSLSQKEGHTTMVWPLWLSKNNTTSKSMISGSLKCKMSLNGCQFLTQVLPI